MATAAELLIKVLADTSSAQKGLAGVEGKAAGMARKMNATGRTLTLGLTAPLLGMGAAAIKAFSEAEKVTAQTEAVIRSTGGAANVSSKHVAELAKTMSQVTAFEDEAIQSTENLLLTFTGIKNQAGAGNDIFNQTTQAALDMSQAMGQDTKSSAIQLGKALNNPLKGLAALGRVGVQFTDQQKDQIKTLVKSGDTLGAQKIILGELKTEFGGAAKAFAETTAGKAQKAMNDLGNAAESFGAILAPAAAGVAKFVSDLATKFQSLSPSTQKLILVIGGIVAAVGPVLIVAAKMVQAFKIVQGAFVALKAVMMANPWILLVAATIALVIIIVKNWSKIKAFLLKVWEGIKAAASAVFNFLKNLFLTFTPLGQIIKHWQTIKDFLLGVWNKIREGVGNLVSKVKERLGDVTDFFRELPGKIIGYIKELPGKMYQLGKDIIGGLVRGIKSAPGAVIDAVKGVAGNAIDSAKRLLHIGSPSKVFIDFGQQIVKGLVVGLEGNTSALSNSMRLITNMILDSPITDTINFINGLSDKVRRQIAPKIAPLLAKRAGNQYAVAEDGSIVPKSFYGGKAPSKTSLPPVGSLLGAGVTKVNYSMTFVLPATVDKTTVGKEVVSAIVAFEKRNGSSWRKA